MGSNAAEHHPIAFKWILRAKEKGATIIHVDPRYTRTSARCDFHVPLRSGTDIAFLGGMINYIIAKDKWFKEYVLNYTNASFIVGKDFQFKDGLFSGYDAKKRKYNKDTWVLEKDGRGIPKRDMSLKNPRCVFNMLKMHYSRYTLDKVSSITGVSKEDLVKVYDVYSATGVPDKAGTECYALGWTHHTVGSQNIRTMSIIQLLLGNMGIAGGGINALRGDPMAHDNVKNPLLVISIETSFIAMCHNCHMSNVAFICLLDSAVKRKMAVSIIILDYCAKCSIFIEWVSAKKKNEKFPDVRI